jgi:hypothetical protein
LSITVLQAKLEPEQDEELNLIPDEEPHLSGDAAEVALKTVSEDNGGIFSASRATGSAAESQVSTRLLQFAPRLMALQTHQFTFLRGRCRCLDRRQGQHFQSCRER